MAKFDIEKAKLGAPVRTRDGKYKARVLCTDKAGSKPIVAILSRNIAGEKDEHAWDFYPDGKFLEEGNNDWDLVIDGNEWEPEYRYFLYVIQFLDSTKGVLKAIRHMARFVQNKNNSYPLILDDELDFKYIFNAACIEVNKEYYEFWKKKKGINEGVYKPAD